MNRTAVLAFAAACGTHAPPVELPAPRPVTRAPDAATAQVVPAAPLVRNDGAQGGAEAPPAGAIATIAVTPDGTAAVTADELGGVRLWPALDGSREPRVVVVPEPHALAIGRRGDGFAIAVLDASGGLYLANVDGDGRSRSHVSLPAEPAYLGIAMTAGGLVAWRADQTVTLLDPDGATRGQLATKPGERLVTVAVAGGHAAALLDRAGKRGVRGLVLTGALAWTDWIERGNETSGTLAVSPSGARFAVRDKDQVAILDATGTLVDRASSFATDVLAFVDDDTLVLATRSGLAWHQIGNRRSLGPRDATTQLLAVAAGGRALSSIGGDLVLATQAQTQYLGYGVESPTVAQPAIDGQLVIGLGDSFLTLDRALRVAGEPTFPVPSGTQVADLHWLGGDAWAVEASQIDNGTTSLVLVGAGKSKVVRGGLTVSHVMMYEPSTHLLTLSLGNAPSVYRFDPVKLELTRLAAVTSDSYSQIELVPLAPARAGGATLLRVSLRDQTTIEWLRDPAKLDAASATVRFGGAIAGADPAGHVFGWESAASGVQLALFAAGKRIGTLPVQGPLSLWREPSGEHVVEIDPQSVSLVALDGTRVWAQLIENASQALWLTDGDLAIVTAAGIARLDGKTGAITAARCGWQFGLSAKPHPPTPRLDPVCVGLEPGH